VPLLFLTAFTAFTAFTFPKSVIDISNLLLGEQLKVILLGFEPWAFSTSSERSYHSAMATSLMLGLFNI